MNLRQQSVLPPTNVDALLVWTRLGNTGDHLIGDACERFLRERGITVWRCDGSIEEAALEGDAGYLGDYLDSFHGMLIFSGGGNIGIYADNERIRAAVIAQAGPRRQCLVFPQSAFQPEPALVDPRVTVWCRDAVSQLILQRAGTRTVLVPDIALYMDDVIPKKPLGEDRFYIKRAPGIDAETIDHHIDLDCRTEDLTFARPLEQIVAVLEPYEFVISDRLHGGLIALMMRKKVVLLPVGYHKIRSFYDTWLCSRPGAAFAKTQAELAAALSRLQAPSDDFKDLFLEYAEPAFNRFLSGAG
jgi:exopolysaccharide biosynthesis predicted pyruvyltransferase EpsI